MNSLGYITAFYIIVNGITCHGQITLSIRPTAQLTGWNHDSHHHRLLETNSTADWYNNNNAIYAQLQILKETEEGRSWLKEFNKARHLSRHEQMRVLEEKTSVTFGNVTNGRRLQHYTFQSAPLLQGFGTHYVTAWVGTPPQRKSVIVDTGSHYTAFPCVGCKNCGEQYHTDQYFDPDTSATFRSLSCSECMAASCNADGKCVFSQSYTEGSSWEAYQVMDRFFVSGNKKEDRDDPVDNSFAIYFMFGCQMSEKGLFVTQLADGIMGMSAHEATLPKQMFNQKKISHNLFTMCFAWEFTVSKSGVDAGILTLGGIDTRLHSSPMVYAKNVVRVGWYTVYVKNIFLRKGGGVSAASPPGAKIIKLPMDAEEVNSGKGVIVDSGTTDTYLSKSMGDSFNEAWMSVTGMKYSNKALRLSVDVVRSLPTLLVQLSAYDLADNSGGNGVGLAGDLDPQNPKDVILAIPAIHYMEYNPNRDSYTSRLYFTEGSGGVLGANAMQGHDVLFDWENGRVGFAESSCNYKELIAPSKEVNDDKTQSVDCSLSSPAVSSSCIDSVEPSQCENADDTAVLKGMEKFVWVIEKVPSKNGKQCNTVVMETMNQNASNELVTVTCDGNGLCYTIAPCQIYCSELKKDKQTDALIPQDSNVPCGDNFWGACTSSCTQSKIISILDNNGQCREVHDKVQTRPCHIDACGQVDPCRVPFLVHTILGIGNVNPTLWNKFFEEIFVQALASSVSDGKLFGPGDVNVLMRNPWAPDISGNKAYGVKLIVEISIFNPRHAKELRSEQSSSLGLPDDEACSEEELYRYAKTALDVHSELQKPSFLNDLILRIEKDLPTTSQIQISQNNAKVSKVLTSWTIKTEPGGRGRVHDHADDESLRHGFWKRFKLLVGGGTLPFVCIAFIAIGLGGYSWYKFEEKKDRAELQRFQSDTPRLDRILNRRSDATVRGRYARVPSSDADMGYGARYSR